METYIREVKVNSPELRTHLLDFKRLSVEVNSKVDEIEKLQSEVQALLQEAEAIKPKMTEIVDSFAIELNEFEVVRDVNLVNEDEDEVAVKIEDNAERFKFNYLQGVNKRKEEEAEQLAQEVKE